MERNITDYDKFPEDWPEIKGLMEKLPLEFVRDGDGWKADYQEEEVEEVQKAIEDCTRQESNGSFPASFPRLHHWRLGNFSIILLDRGYCDRNEVAVAIYVDPGFIVPDETEEDAQPKLFKE